MTSKPRIALWDIPPISRRRPEPDNWITEVVWQVVPTPRPDIRHHAVTARSGWTSIVQ